MPLGLKKAVNELIQLGFDTIEPIVSVGLVRL